MLEVERIGKLRKQLGLTQKELATLAGVSQSLIAKIESGKIDPAYSKVMQILSALENEHSKGKKTAGQIMSAGLAFVSPNDRITAAIKLMKEKDISQVPVLEGGKCVGSLSESDILDLVSAHRDLKRLHVREAMKESFPVIPANSVVDIITDLLRHYSAVLVEKDGHISGIITKADLFKAI
ncbi:MAG TPA: CBS domain-containing protein [Candidatus Bilamarchaeum sp.]|nr:CBS domain-containing protein [Candidatus Bilamarchaeum sp.]